MMVRSISSPALFRTALIGLALAFMAMTTSDRLIASEGELAVKRDYSAVVAGPAPEEQSKDDAAAKSAGCISCHSASDAWTMHKTEAVVLGCTDCHGGNAKVALPSPSLAFKDRKSVV